MPLCPSKINCTTIVPGIHDPTIGGEKSRIANIRYHFDYRSDLSMLSVQTIRKFTL